MHTIFLTMILSAAPAPHFVPIPKFPTLEVPVTVEVAPTMVWGITGYTQACPSCPLEPQYGWVRAEPSIDQAARRLEKWRNLPKDEVKRLAKIVDGPALKKAIRQEWSLGSCGMACRAHGSNLYDVAEDGTVTLAKEQPAVAPNEGGAGFGGRFRIFRGRR